MFKGIVRVCVVAAFLSCATQALAADTVLWSEDFNSYTAGNPPPVPWADWSTGTGPASTTIVGGGNTGNCMQMAPSWAEPIHWFTNGFDVNNRVVTLTWYVKGDVGGEGWASSYPGLMDMYWGSMEGGYGTPQTSGQYNGKVGAITVNGEWTAQGTNLTPVQYDGVWYWNPVLKDGITWNKFELTAIGRSVRAGGVTGEATLTISYTDPNGVFNTMTTPAGRFGLSSIGLTGFDTYAEATGDGSKTWYVDDISVVQNEELAAPPSGLPTPLSTHPGAHGMQGGGITSDGQRYLYVTSGTLSNGELYRYDTATGTWAKMASRPTARDGHDDQYEAHGIGIATVGEEGTITVFAGDQFPTACNAYDYDIATNTWAPAVAGDEYPPATYDAVKGAEAAGAFTFGGIIQTQSGFVVYDNATHTFVRGQTDSYLTPPGGWGAGFDMAYAGGDYVYLLNHNDTDTGKGVLERWDIAAGEWVDPNHALAEMPVAFPEAGQSALTYVPDGIDSLYIIHQVWGQAGLYEVQVQGGGLIAALDGSDDLYRYDTLTNTWTVLADVLPFAFGEGDDITAGVPEPASIILLLAGTVRLVRRRVRR